MVNLIGFVNAGYVVISSYFNDTLFGVVIAKNDTKNEYVLWNVSFLDGTPNFYWGYYTECRSLAIDRFCEKIKAMEGEQL